MMPDLSGHNPTNFHASIPNYFRNDSGEIQPTMTPSSGLLNYRN